MTVVAYCVISHQLPGQLLRLVRAIRSLSPQAPVLLHHDARGPSIDRRALGALGEVQLLPPEPAVEWGRGSQLDLQLRCLREAADRVDPDWLVLLSGQDYPVRRLDVVERELATADVDGFVEGHLVTPPAWRRDAGDDFARRYFYHWRPVREPGRLGRRLVVAARPVLALRDLPSGVVVGHRARTPFTAAMPCRRGSDWLTLSRRSVRTVLRAAAERPGLVTHFRRTVSPTEAFAHTVLHAEPGLSLSGDIRRHTAWRPGSANPRVLDVSDLDAILASNTDFARKFDERVDARVLAELDRVLGL